MSEDIKSKSKHCKNPINPKLAQIKLRKKVERSWTLAEQKIYLNVLRQNLSNMRTPLQRKRLKIFKIIADILKTRTSSQVKSHHQKLLQKFKDIDTIVEKLQQFVLKVEVQQLRQVINLQNIYQTCPFEQIYLHNNVNEVDYEDQRSRTFFLYHEDIMEHEIRVQIHISIDEPLI